MYLTPKTHVTNFEKNGQIIFSCWPGSIDIKTKLQQPKSQPVVPCIALDLTVLDACSKAHTFSNRSIFFARTIVVAHQIIVPLSINLLQYYFYKMFNEVSSLTLAVEGLYPTAEVRTKRFFYFVVVFKFNNKISVNYWKEAAHCNLLR